MLGLILVIAFISAWLLFYSLMNLTAKVNLKPISRIDKYTGEEQINNNRKKRARKDFKTGLYFISKGISSARFLDGYKKTIQFKLNRAHILLKPEEYITIGIGLFLASGLLAYLISENLLSSAAAAVIGWLVPSLVIKSKIKRRVKLLNEQLGDAIVLISNSLKAGYSFFQAVDVVVKEMNGPIAEEFSYLQKEINLGQATEKALENLVGRVLSDDLELVITAVLIQRQTGGNLSEILDNISFTIRDRVKIKGDIKTITAQGRMSGLVISLIPPVLFVVLYMMNPENMGLLLKTSLGNIILAAAAVMELIGIFAIKKIVKIEF